MEFLFVLVPPAAALLVIAPLIRRIVASWRAAAHQLGYTYVPGVLGTLGRIVGRLPHCHVEVSLGTGEMMLIEIDGGRLPYDLALIRRGLIPKIGEISTGDFQFDSRVSTTGTTSTALAALPMVARMRIARLAEDGRVSVRDGRLTVCFSRPRPVADLVEAIRDAVDLFERMTWTGSVDERLLDNFEHERDPSVRDRLFRLLLQEGSESVRQRAIQRGVGDLNPDVRLAAVKALKGAGWEESVALYEDRRVPARHRGEVLRHLALTFGRERALPLVEAGLAHDSPEICAVAVTVIKNWRYAPAIGRLATLRHREAEIVEQVAAALGRIGGPRAQEILLALLGSGHRGVRSAAIHALGRAGDLEVIPKLTRIKDFGLKGVVREAIGAIQARCGREAEGALSLSPESTHEGSVSLSEEEGRVSMAEPRSREK